MGRFLVGFVIGLLIGAGAVVLAGPRSGRPQGIGDLVDATMSAARRASRPTHQTSSVPTSVTCARSVTGTVRPSSPSAVSVASSGASSSISPSLHCSTTVPGTSFRRTDDPKKRNSAGSPTTSPNSAAGSAASLPSSMPKGATQSAFTGVGMPGTAGAAVSTPT